nr:uracil-DNA glycosylase family protein [Salsuginibacillus kocurii]
MLGMAPGAHGGNRTGRPFTGDGGGHALFQSLYDTGFSTQAESHHIDDGLRLKDVYISNAVKCCPPKNKPVAAEYEECKPFLEQEIKRLQQLQVIVALGGEAFAQMKKYYKSLGKDISKVAFAHNASYFTDTPTLPTLVGCYHPSQYNLNTKRLTPKMLRDILYEVKEKIK